MAVFGLCERYDRNGEGDNDHYSQPGNLFRLMSPQDQQHTISNIVGAMQGITGPKREEIIMRQLCHFFRADVKLGMGIAQGLNVQIDMQQLMPAAMQTL